MRRGGCWGVHEKTLGTEDQDVGCNRGIGVHWGSEVFVSRGGDENIIRVDGNVFMKRGEEEGVKDFLGNSGGSGRHRWWEDDRDRFSFIMLFARVFFGACSGGSHRSLQSGLERTSPTLEPKSLPMGGTPSIARGIGDFVVFHGSGI